MSSFLVGLSLAILAPLVGARLLSLVRGRAGWLTYLCCVATETIQKRAGLARSDVELAQAVLGLVFLTIAGVGPTVLISTVAALSCLEVAVRACDGRILRNVYASPVKAAGEPGPPGALTCLDPSMDPALTLSFVGPFVDRMPHLDLGRLWLGQELELVLAVANHTLIPTQTPIECHVIEDGGLDLEQKPSAVLPRLRPGEVNRWALRFKVTASDGPGKLRLRVAWGRRTQDIDVRHGGAGPRPRGGLRDARITRYSGGCRAAFAWRGDMDLYDEVTFQSIEGLEETLSLAARYRMPQTLYLSTRLSLDAAEAEAYALRFGVDRGARRIPEFVAWMRENVDLRHSEPYPFESTKRFLVELGNHGHLHFGTDAAAAPANSWRLRTRLGGGRYPWLTDETGSFAEQRDNAVEAARQCEVAFGFRPRSWAMPDRTRDSETPRAVEAAGCDVLSDSDVRTIDNVLLQPPPHHPDGTRAVELTKRYPGDPLDVYHVAMNVFWFHRAHRLGIPVVFMCHQHLRAYESRSCAVYTEYLLRYVLESFNGDLHVNTVYGIGKYWREVLSPATRSVTVRIEGSEIVVTNRIDESFRHIPVDLSTADGHRWTRLVTVAAGAEEKFDAFG